MPIRYAEKKIILEGVCAIEEVTALAEFLEATPEAVATLENCEHLHTCVLQTLLAYGVALEGQPYHPFLWKWISPLFARPGGSKC